MIIGLELSGLHFVGTAIALKERYYSGYAQYHWTISPSYEILSSIGSITQLTDTVWFIQAKQ